VHVLAAGGETAFAVANRPEGIDQLVAELVRLSVGRVALEPTGRLHLAAWRALDAAGIAVVAVNPQRARAFAEAIGKLAKLVLGPAEGRTRGTDRVDARELALAAARLDLPAAPPPGEELCRIRELHAHRRSLVAERVALANRARTAEHPLVRRQLARAMRLVRQLVREAETALAALVAADPARAREREILCSIPGIGPASALALIADLPELGHASGKEIAALVGVAPVARDSGAFRGRRHIRAGRAPLRAALHRAALAAARANPALRAFRERLRARGKPHRVVLTAVLRKLVVLANALVRDNRLWTPEPA
jgi:transposase